MFGSDAENEFESLLETMVPGDRALMMHRLSIIAAHFNAAMVAGINTNHKFKERMVKPTL